MTTKPLIGYKAGKQYKDGGDDSGLVHIPAPHITGGHTLCGFFDTGFWEDVKDPINCPLCLAIWDYVKNNKVRRTK